MSTNLLLLHHETRVDKSLIGNGRTKRGSGVDLACVKSLDWFWGIEVDNRETKIPDDFYDGHPHGSRVCRGRKGMIKGGRLQRIEAAKV